MKRLLLALLLAALAIGPAHGQGTVMPIPVVQFFSNTGVPLAGGFLYTYVAGTTTPLATYNNVDLAPGHQNANPIVLDSAGRAVVYLQAASYLFILKTSAGVTVWSQDNISSVALANILIGVTAQPFFGTADAYVVSSSYPSGATFDKCHAGSSIVTIDSANLLGTYALQGMLGATGGGTTSAALVNLSDGSPDTALVTISSSSSVGALVTSSTITFAAAGTPKSYCVKLKVTGGGAGYAWGLGLKRLS